MSGHRQTAASGHKSFSSWSSDQAVIRDKVGPIAMRPLDSRMWGINRESRCTYVKANCMHASIFQHAPFATIPQL